MQVLDDVALAQDNFDDNDDDDDDYDDEGTRGCWLDRVVSHCKAKGSSNLPRLNLKYLCLL